MLRKSKKQTLRGDTLVEVMFAVGIFSMVAISVSTLMTSMLGKAQSAIEIVMARSEIDSQAEAIRFIHSSRKNPGMVDVWNEIDDIALNANAYGYNPDDFFLTNVDSCNEFARNPILQSSAFYIDTFGLNNPSAATVVGKSASISIASVFPRVLHTTDSGDSIIKYYEDTNTTSSRAEGIWVIAVKDDNPAKYYDFYIQTCWDTAGNSFPSTISTIVRLRTPIVKENP